MDLQKLTVPTFLTLAASVYNRVQLHVTQPFIDEIFHLRQCQVYCRHDFHTWDNKITTPPGLYILGSAYAYFLSFLGIDNACGAEALRSLNLLAGAAILPLVLSLVRTSNFWKINIVSLPLLFSYYFLFYTDVWATVLVVAAVLIIAKSRTLSGAVQANLVGFCSLWFRQTNIVWVAFAGLLLIDMRRRRKSTFLENVLSFVEQAFSDWKMLIPFCVNGVLFAAFVKINGGITFGDKENHQVSLHLVQIFYCYAFMAALTLPLWAGKTTLKNYYRFAFAGNRHANVFLTAVSFFLIYCVIKHFTVVHPFLLADNRHYTFYIYRRIISRPYSSVVLVPVYHFSMWLISDLLSETSKFSPLSISPVLVLGFFGCVSLTLIPSPLFEPRYYIVPLVLFRIFTRPVNATSQRERHLYEFLWYTFINTVFFVVFFSYEFTWASEAGIQRIIW